MKKLSILFFTLLCATAAFSQHEAIGIRLGQPMGLTYKHYFSNFKAVEFIIGSGAPSWNQNYYENDFDKRNTYADYNYRSHKVTSTLYLQGRYLIHYDIPVQGMEGKLDWYWGVGGLLKIANVRYRYQNKMAPFNDYNDTRTDIDFGPELIIGMEYTFEDVPITLFGEVSLMIEIADRPGALRTFAGTGARYNF